MLNTNNLKSNQTFKNYKELCNFLNEPIKTGKAKQLQLKEWERFFLFLKEGQKIIITEIFDIPKEKIDKRANNKGGNNNKNVKPMMDYIMHIFNPDYMNEYYTISIWSTLILKILNKDVCDMIYRDDETISQFCEDNHIADQKLFREYVGTVKYVTKTLITTAFRCLKKKKLLEYQEGYKFYYEGDKYNKTVSTDVLNEYIDSMEREICQKINDEYFLDKNIKGKQLVYILQHSKNKELLQLYMDMRMKCMNDSDDVLCALNDIIWEEDAGSPDFIDGEDKRLLSYYRAYIITAFDDTSRMEYDNRKEVVDKIIELSVKRITDVKFKKFGEEYHPYNNKESLMEIERINDIMFKNRRISIHDVNKTLEEYADEYLEELDEIFSIAS